MSMAAMPPAIRVPYKFLESVRMRSIRQISRAYRDSTNAAPSESEALPDHGEDEVGVPLGDEVELGLGRIDRRVRSSRRSRWRSRSG